MQRRMLLSALAPGVALGCLGLTAAPARAQTLGDKIVLGQSAPLSGPAAQLGLQMQAGAKLYFAKAAIATEQPDQVLVAARDHALGEQKPLGQFHIRTRRPHRHGEGGTAHPDFEGFLDCQGFRAGYGAARGDVFGPASCRYATHG